MSGVNRLELLFAEMDNLKVSRPTAIFYYLTKETKTVLLSSDDLEELLLDCDLDHWVTHMGHKMPQSHFLIRNVVENKRKGFAFNKDIFAHIIENADMLLKNDSKHDFLIEFFSNYKNFGFTPNSDIFRTLINGFTMYTENRSNGLTSLYVCFINNVNDFSDGINFLSYFMTSKYDINYQNIKGNTILHSLVIQYYDDKNIISKEVLVDIIRKLIQLGAKIDLANFDGKTVKQLIDKSEWDELNLLV